jgi:hypothetical protein
MLTMTLEEFQAAIKSQGVPIEHVAMRCPRCNCLQTATDLIEAGAGQDLDSVQGYLGFSCLGRFTGAGMARKEPDGQPCNWTLGGLFSIHKMEVLTPDGARHPRFELATPDEAQHLMISRAKCSD